MSKMSTVKYKMSKHTTSVKQQISNVQNVKSCQIMSNIETNVKYKMPNMSNMSNGKTYNTLYKPVCNQCAFYTGNQILKLELCVS